VNGRSTFTIALAGQPNVGKSTIFNSLTHKNQYVSNWPGKTCEITTGSYISNDTQVDIVDLPGLYSLTANSEEECIAREFLIDRQADVVIAVVDAVALERSLYLVADLIYLPIPVIIALNKLDLASQQGITVEPHVLEAALGLPVVPMVASRDSGMSELIETALRVAQSPSTNIPNRPEVQADHKTVFEELKLCVTGKVPEPYSPEWVALKLLEGDAQISDLMRSKLGSEWDAVAALLAQHDDSYLAVASGRYEWIGRMVRAAIVHPKAGQLTVTDQIDHLATHHVWGVFLLLGVLGFLFWITYLIGTPIQIWLEVHLVQGGAEWVRAHLMAFPAWFVGMLAGGIITGVGTVLTLVPVLIIFFTGLGILEDCGYMARAAFVTDRFMHHMGLHGNSFLPLFLALGCNVPAVMGTRIINSPKARLTTILVIPTVPCLPKIAVMTFLAPIIFGPKAVWVTLGLLGLVVLVIAGLGTAYHKFLLGEEHTSFIMELPLYHVPDLRNISKGMWQRLEDFLRGAGTVILIFSIVLWWLTNYPGGGIEASYMAMAGRWLSPIGQLLGLNWQMMVALLSTVVRSENIIPTLAVIYGTGQGGDGLASALRSQLTPATALAFLAVQTIFIPCAATIATVRQETKSWRWTLLNIAVSFFVSLSVGFLIYRGALLLGWGV
jgi:ferrous iron transport protein B